MALARCSMVATDGSTTKERLVAESRAGPEVRSVGILASWISAAIVSGTVQWGYALDSSAPHTHSVSVASDGAELASSGLAPPSLQGSPMPDYDPEPFARVLLRAQSDCQIDITVPLKSWVQSPAGNPGLLMRIPQSIRPVEVAYPSPGCRRSPELRPKVVIILAKGRNTPKWKFAELHPWACGEHPTHCCARRGVELVQ